MRIPNENLYAYDFNCNAAQRKPVDPPPDMELRFSGKIEVLKPLVRSADFVKSEATGAGAPIRPVLHRLSWFHRSLAIGGLAIVVLPLGIAFYGPPAEHAAGLISVVIPDDVPMDGQPAEMLAPPEKPGGSASSTDVGSASEGFLAVGRVARPWRVRTRVLVAAYRPRRLARRPHLLLSRFVPTTLIIYAENGEIKTRIEPQLTAGYKRPLPLPY